MRGVRCAHLLHDELEGAVCAQAAVVGVGNGSLRAGSILSLEGGVVPVQGPGQDVSALPRIGNTRRGISRDRAQCNQILVRAALPKQPVDTLHAFADHWPRRSAGKRRGGSQDTVAVGLDVDEHLAVGGVQAHVLRQQRSASLHCSFDRDTAQAGAQP